jgi:hypothetical protein
LADLRERIRTTFGIDAPQNLKHHDHESSTGGLDARD